MAKISVKIEAAKRYIKYWPSIAKPVRPVQNIRKIRKKASLMRI